MTEIYSYPNWSVSITGLVISLVLFLFYILAVFIIFSNVKFNFMLRFFKPQKKHTRLEINDLKKVYRDYNKHFEDFYETTSNYKKNKHNLNNVQYAEVVDSEFSRHNRPYFIMRVGHLLLIGVYRGL